MDFGQFPLYESWENFNPYSAFNYQLALEKPIGAFAKYLDDCEMSSYQTFTLDTLAFKDMLGLVLSSTPGWLNTATGSDDPKWYLLGSGGYNNYCWPGQLDYLAY